MNLGSIRTPQVSGYFNGCFYAQGKRNVQNKSEGSTRDVNISSGTEKTSFQACVNEARNTSKKEYKNAVEDYKKRHPEYASTVDNQVRAGKKVLERNNAVNVDRESMTMDEYKQFFTYLMNSIPYDSSQFGDVNVWTISEKGWEQMKNDPDYEAWILGYTSVDRSFHNPWASMPGYSPSYHTERFGDSIDEHLGQSSPMKSADSDDGESWWDKRIKRAKEIAKENMKKANKDAAAREEADERISRQKGIQENARIQAFLNGRTVNPAFDNSFMAGQAAQLYEGIIASFLAGGAAETGTKA